jgi:acetyl-CoA carboxylase carboxyltransferase component
MQLAGNNKQTANNRSKPQKQADAMVQIRQWLSYLPQHVGELPPVRACSDPVDRRAEELLFIVPRQRRQGYNTRRLLALVVDAGSLFEVGTVAYGREVVCALARLDGVPVGVFANDNSQLAGSLTAQASNKLRRFLDFCQIFHLPVHVCTHISTATPTNQRTNEPTNQICNKSQKATVSPGKKKKKKKQTRG